MTALEDEKYQRHQEVLLLTEVLEVLRLSHLEGIHGDGLFLAIRDICSTEIAAQSLITVTCIDNHHIGILLVILTHDCVHEERLTATRRAKNKEVRVVGVLYLSFLTCGVDRHRHTLTVSIVTLHGRIVTMRLTLLVHQAQGSIRKCQETVVVLTETIYIARERGHKEFKLVVGTFRDMDALTAEDILQMVGHLLHIFLGIHRHNEVIVGIDELFSLSCYHLLHLLDVLDGHLV